MLKRVLGSGLRTLLLAGVVTGWGCASKSTDSNAEEGQGGDGQDYSKMVSMPEVVFDPRNPPAGFTSCHRNHCHREGGGVASYQQVMQEIGATKAINIPKPKPMPEAPSDVAAVPSDAKRTKSGLATKVLKPGSGAKPTPDSTVVVHYTGWTSDGVGFDSSVAPG